MSGPVLLRFAEVRFRNRSNCEAAMAVRRLIDDFEKQDERREKFDRPPIFKEPEIARIFFEDIAQRLERA
jgi:hypothetical protein